MLHSLRTGENDSKLPPVHRFKTVNLVPCGKKCIEDRESWLVTGFQVYFSRIISLNFNLNEFFY